MPIVIVEQNRNNFIGECANISVAGRGSYLLKSVAPRHTRTREISLELNYVPKGVGKQLPSGVKTSREILVILAANTTIYHCHEWKTSNKTPVLGKLTRRLDITRMLYGYSQWIPSAERAGQPISWSLSISQPITNDQSALATGCAERRGRGTRLVGIGRDRVYRFARHIDRPAR